MAESSNVLRDIYESAKPLIGDQLDLAERLTDIRKRASELGINWSAVKALIKAEILDDRDETGSGKRVGRIIDNAATATAYAEMLGIGSEKVNEQNFISEPESGACPSGQYPDKDDPDLLGIPAFLRRAE